MSIAINLYYTGEGDNARKFAEEMESSGTAELIRAEKWNLRYEYFLPMNAPQTVLLIDEWEDQQAVDRHHASPMMQTVARLRDKYDLHMKAWRYISEQIPEADESFLRK